MAYKQNNPLSRKPSPLNDIKIDSRDGTPYPHKHGPNDRFRSVQGRQIQAPTGFNENTNRNFRQDGNKVNAEDMNLEYLQNIANIYNQGGFSPGSTFTGGSYYNRANAKPGQGLNILGLNFSTPQRGSTGVRDKLVIKNPGRSKGIQGQAMYGLGDNWVMNEDTGQYDFEGDASTLTAPDQQYTAEQLYDIMSSGDGMMQYIDGIGFVGGNQAGVRHDISGISDDRSHHGFFSGNKNWEYTDDSEWSTGENMPWLVNEADYDPNNPYVESEEVVEEVVNQKPQTVAELLAARKARSADAVFGPSRKSSKKEPFYRRSSKSSPLNQIDPKDGFTYNEGVVAEPVPVYDNAGKLIGYNTDTTFSGTKLVPGTEGVPGGLVPIDGVDPVNGGSPGSPGGEPTDNISYFESFNNEKNIGEGFDPGWDPTDPVDLQAFKDWRTFMKTAPVAAVEDQTLTDQYTTTAFEPYVEEEIIEEKPPAFSIGTQSVGKRTGGKVKIGLPDFSGMSLPQLRKASRKCGSCKNRGLIQRAILALGGGI